MCYEYPNTGLTHAFLNPLSLFSVSFLSKSFTSVYVSGEDKVTVIFQTFFAIKILCNFYEVDGI